jgi:hypothetical protein
VGISALVFLLFFCHRRRNSYDHTISRLGTNHDNNQAPMLKNQGTYRPRSGGHDENREVFPYGIDSPIATASRQENQEPRLLTHRYASTSSLFGATALSNDVSRSRADLCQIEPRRQMQDIQREIANLERTSTSQIPSSEPIHDADSMRDNIELLRAEVELVKRAQLSQSLSNEQAPHTRHLTLTRHIRDAVLMRSARCNEFTKVIQFSSPNI